MPDVEVCAPPELRTTTDGLDSLADTDDSEAAAPADDLDVDAESDAESVDRLVKEESLDEELDDEELVEEAPTDSDTASDSDDADDVDAAEDSPDEPDSPASATATPGQLATAVPIPNATANAPTRPITLPAPEGDDPTATGLAWLTPNPG